MKKPTPNCFIKLFIQERFGSREYVIPQTHPLYWELFNLGELAEHHEEKTP